MVTVKLGNWSLGFGSESGDNSKKPIALVILDGWGHASASDGNAISVANTPNFDRITNSFPGTTLAASGDRVGLSPKTPGNPEIGHLNIGTGRAITSRRLRIEKALSDGSFFENKALKKAFKRAQKKKKAVHLVGLLSDAGVEASTETLFSLLRFAKKLGFEENVYLHGILDGVDVDPRSADIYVEAVGIKLADIGLGELATICGRQFAMDESGDWQKTARAYTMLTHADGITATDPVDAIRESYLRGVTDEFIPPTVFTDESGEAIAKIEEDDTVIFFNHRGQQMVQLAKSIADANLEDSGAFKKPNVHVVTLTDYDSDLSVSVAFGEEAESNALAKVFEDHEIRNLRFSESDRIKHMTFFFNGRHEQRHVGEERVLISTEGINEEERPELGSFKLADSVIQSIEKEESDVYIVNLSAADVAARSGNLGRTIEAIQFVDTCLGGIVNKVREKGGIALVTSDHGNCEDMSLNGSAPTPYTRNRVPFYLVADFLADTQLRDDGALEDVAPTLLGILGIETPEDMTGSDLRIEE